MKTNNLHSPVLLKEAINMLKINKTGIYVDCTAGYGGHSEQIIKKLTTGKLICIDCDINAINYLIKKFKENSNIIIIHDNFRNINQILKSLSISKVDGVLVDLGVSSPMFDDINRGFSYHNDAKLDMRMNQEQKFSAIQLLNNSTKKELIDIFKNYGEVKNPIFVVKNIIETRMTKKIETTKQFVDLIKSSISYFEKNKDKHPAKQYFQAIRIAVNDELRNLESFLNSIPNFLNNDGVIAIISFHSLEDRIIKQKFLKLCTSSLPKEIPLNIKANFSLINKKPIVAGAYEIQHNHRSRSAKLRGIEKNNE